MGPVRELSATERSQVHILHQEGYPKREIARKLHIAASTVCKTLTRITELNSYHSRSRSGAPKKLSAYSDRVMRRYATANPGASSHEIRSILPENVAASTVRRHLVKNLGLRSYKPAKKPLLSKKNVIDRIAFCKRYQHWSAADWANVMFSDETKISQFNSNRRTVRRPKNQRFNPLYLH